MHFKKTFTSKEVLRIIAELVSDTLPEGSVGCVKANYIDEDGSIEVSFIPDEEPRPRKKKGSKTSPKKSNMN